MQILDEVIPLGKVLGLLWWCIICYAPTLSICYRQSRRRLEKFILMRLSYSCLSSQMQKEFLLQGGNKVQFNVIKMTEMQKGLFLNCLDYKFGLFPCWHMLLYGSCGAKVNAEHDFPSIYANTRDSVYCLQWNITCTNALDCQNVPANSGCTPYLGKTAVHLIALPFRHN